MVKADKARYFDFLQAKVDSKLTPGDSAIDNARNFKRMLTAIAMDNPSLCDLNGRLLKPSGHTLPDQQTHLRGLLRNMVQGEAVDLIQDLSSAEEMHDALVIAYASHTLPDLANALANISIQQEGSA